MSRDPRYDILFEPVQIGPLTARNRFYQVPHCNGMGYRYPSALAAMRGVKAEGGWAVVCTEEVEIHPSAEVSPYTEGRLWSDEDIPAHARVCEAIHAHGALAGIELCYNGHHSTNRYSRAVPLAPAHLPVAGYDPVQARAMDKHDIADFRQWHRDAVRRSLQAGYDIVYCYAGHDLTLPMHFISRRYNQRTDEYGGSLENRVRLFREMIEDTREILDGRAALAVRFAVDELMGDDGIAAGAEGREVVEMLAELPDLWDVNVSDWPNDSVTSRFGPEGAQEPYIAFVKSVTSKPVVGVGRFTSPDTMVSQVRRGVLDMIGAARPSIADPFLPRKIEEGRVEDIRECIGCNICVSGDYSQVPMRCTQNPTMGEEWRRGWHPERLPPRRTEDSVLVVGAGPAGLECTRALGQRGYRVTLAEAREELGGRVTLESALPGLAEWARVRDHRVWQISQMANVEVYRGSAMDLAHVLEFGAGQVVIATGSHWRRDGVGRRHWQALPGLEHTLVYTPDDIMAGVRPDGPVVVYDDDHFYLGGLMAELLRAAGREVTLVTPAADVSHYTHFTMEQQRIQAGLMRSGVTIVTLHAPARVEPGCVVASCEYTGEERRIECASLVLVTARLPEDSLYQALRAADTATAGIASVTRVGDCVAPATIAHAVHDGHRRAREQDEPSSTGVGFRRELAALAVHDAP